MGQEEDDEEMLDDEDEYDEEDEMEQRLSPLHH